MPEISVDGRSFMFRRVTNWIYEFSEAQLDAIMEEVEGSEFTAKAAAVRGFAVAMLTDLCPDLTAEHRRAGTVAGVRPGYWLSVGLGRKSDPSIPRMVANDPTLKSTPVIHFAPPLWPMRDHDRTAPLWIVECYGFAPVSRFKKHGTPRPRMTNQIMLDQELLSPPHLLGKLVRDNPGARGLGRWSSHWETFRDRNEARGKVCG